MITVQQVIGTIRKLAFASAVSLGAATTVSAGWFANCCDPPRAYYTPECEPTWGYHQTCWRQFPPLKPCVGWGDYCPTCQTGDQGQYSPNVDMGTLQGGTVYHNDGSFNGMGPNTQVPQVPSNGMNYQSGPVYSTTPGGAMMVPGPGSVPGAPLPMNGSVPNAPAPSNMQPQPVNPVPMNPQNLPLPPLPGQAGSPEVSSSYPAAYMRTPAVRPMRSVSQSQPLPSSWQGQPTQQWQPAPQSQPPQFYPNGQVYPAGQMPNIVSPASAAPALSERISNGAARLRNAVSGTRQNETYRPDPSARPQPAPVPQKPSLWSRLTSW